MPFSARPFRNPDKGASPYIDVINTSLYYRRLRCRAPVYSPERTDWLRRGQPVKICTSQLRQATQASVELPGTARAAAAFNTRCGLLATVFEVQPYTTASKSPCLYDAVTVLQ